MRQSIYRSKRTSSVLLILLFLFIIAIPGVIPGLSLATSLTLLHTNDTHSHLLPFNYPSIIDACSPFAYLRERNDIGGIARRATLVRQIRADLKAKGTKVWLVDAGDFSDGTPFSIEYYWEADIAAMNVSGYDFGTLGNHEFNYNLARTQKLISLSRYPILCANATLTATGELLTKAYRVEKVGRVRVGLFGLVTKEAESYTAAKEGVSISDEIVTARKVVAELRPKADIIVLISHCGEEMDKQLASAVPDIDAIVGGHSHSRLPSGEFVWRSENLMAGSVNGTVIVQAHQWGGELGQCDLLFEKDSAGRWHVSRYRARLIPVTGVIQSDAEVAMVVNKYWDPIAPRYAEVIGQALGDFSSRCDDLTEYNLMADAIRETFGTEVVVENLGGVRSPLAQGKVTRGDLATLDPFGDTIVTFKIPGLQLKKILKTYTPAVSGLRYRRENGELIEVTVSGQPVKDNQTYTGATNSYFAGKALKDLEVHDTKKPRLDVLIDYIRQKGTIRPAYDGRRVVIDSDRMINH